MRPSDKDAMDESKKPVFKDVMRERKLLFQVERHFRPKGNCSSNQDDLGKNALKDTLQKKSSQNKKR